MVRLYRIILALSCILLLAACKRNEASSSTEAIPLAPDYAESTMWYAAENDQNGQGADVFYIVSTCTTDWKTADGRICHYADVRNTQQRAGMGGEIRKVARYMADGNNFYAPYYRQVAIDTWATLDENIIGRRFQLSMNDVKKAFDHFNAKRDKKRPLVLAGFSQGGKAVVELLKHIDKDTYSHLVAAYVLGYKVTPDDTLQCKQIVAAKDSTDVGVTICYNTVKDVKYIQPIVCKPCAMCINPVNWHTDATPAVLHDTISVSVSPEHHVLVVTGYSGSEYAPILGILNVGDIHSCEPWLYSECLRRNIALRTKAWRQGRMND